MRTSKVPPRIVQLTLVFAGWQLPIGALSAPLTRQDVLRNDIEELPAMHRG